MPPDAMRDMAFSSRETLPDAVEDDVVFISRKTLETAKPSFAWKADHDFAIPMECRFAFSLVEGTMESPPEPISAVILRCYAGCVVTKAFDAVSCGGAGGVWTDRRKFCGKLWGMSVLVLGSA